MDDDRIIFNGMEMDARMPKIIADAQRDPQYRIAGKIYDRIPWGRETHLPELPQRACPDCGTAVGQLHLRACDIEQCPVCGQQAIAFRKKRGASPRACYGERWGDLIDRLGITMRIAALILCLIFSLISVWGLLNVVNVEFYRFMPVSPGPEGGLMDAGLGFVVGGIASLIALLFAFLHFWRRPRAMSSRVLLAWCCLVSLGFVFDYLHMMSEYGRAHAA
jgi:hypothetical protein